MHEDNNTSQLKRIQSNIKNSTHRLPEQQEYDTGQEYINRLADTL